MCCLLPASSPTPQGRSIPPPCSSSSSSTEEPLTQCFHRDLSGQRRRQVDAHQVHVLVQQHVVDPVGVEGHVHLLGQLLRLLLRPAPQRFDGEALVLQQRDDHPGGQAGAEHADPGQHGSALLVWFCRCGGFQPELRAGAGPAAAAAAGTIHLQPGSRSAAFSRRSGSTSGHLLPVCPARNLTHDQMWSRWSVGLRNVTAAFWLCDSGQRTDCARQGPSVSPPPRSLYPSCTRSFRPDRTTHPEVSFMWRREDTSSPGRTAPLPGGSAAAAAVKFCWSPIPRLEEPLSSWTAAQEVLLRRELQNKSWPTIHRK